MDTEPTPAPPGPRSRLGRAAGWVALAIIWLVLSAAAAFGTYEWRLRTEAAPAAARADARVAELAAQQADLRARQGELTNRLNQIDTTQSALDRRIQQVEQAAQDARLLVQSSEGTLTLAEKLRQIDELAAALTSQKQETARQVADLQKTLEGQLGKKSEETAAAALAQLRWRSLLLRAQAEVLKAQVDLAEGNRGLAREELGLALKTLQEAEPLLPSAAGGEVKAILEAAEQTRTALALELSTARDTLGLLWHRLGRLVTN